MSHFIDQHFSIIAAIWFTGFVCAGAYVFYNGWRRSKIDLSEVLYEESGQCAFWRRSLLDRLQAGYNVFNIAFLKDRLVIRAMFPFNVMQGIDSIDQELPYHQIVDVHVQQKRGKRPAIIITFGSGKDQRTLEFTVRDVDRAMSFLEANPYPAPGT